MDHEALAHLAERLGGSGCIVRHGFMVMTWGDPTRPVSWMSSTKPVISSLLFFAIEEGKVSGVDERIAKWGWELKPKDRTMTFRHLANMISGFARPEAPGAAFAYNDYGIQLYKLTMEKALGETLENAVRKRLAPLQFQDKLTMPRMLHASPRDFARICWFWRHRGRWQAEQLLPRKYFDEYMKPHVPKDLPETDHSAKGNDDYLEIGTYGGGSDHFTQYGPGIYGFNWWFNSTGRRHPDTLTWPDAPPDAIMTIGFGGNNAVIIPSLDLVLTSGSGHWGNLDAGKSTNEFNQHIKRLVEAVRR